jgi:hypothetical protein
LNLDVGGGLGEYLLHGRDGTVHVSFLKLLMRPPQFLLKSLDVEILCYLRQSFGRLLGHCIDEIDRPGAEQYPADHRHFRLR